MPIQSYNDPATTTISGSLTVAADARTGDPGTITAAAIVSSAAAAATGITLSNNVIIASKDNSGGGTTSILQHGTSDNTTIRAKNGQSVTLGDAANNYLTISSALAFLSSTALQLGQSATPTGAAQTIATNTGIISRTAPSGACTGAIMQPGTKDGQLCIVTNENVASTTNIITFSATIATANVINDGTNPQVVKCGTAKAFVWLASLNAAAGAWVPLAAYAG
jgi:hypothetical protein